MLSFNFFSIQIIKNNTMKNISSYFLLLSVMSLLLTSSCKKDFLDLKPYDASPFDDAIVSETDLEVAVNGVYASLRTSAMYGRTLPMMGDVMADNVFISPVNSGRYLA